MRTNGALFVGCALSLFGCTEGQSDTTGEGSGDEKTGLSVLAAVEAESGIDIAYVRYGIDRVACTEGEQYTALHRDVRTELVPMPLPGGLPEVPVEDGSQHAFADHFEVVPPGCYDILATPLGADTNPSPKCGAASQNDVRVTDGETTEIVLLSQCTGAETGSLDAVVAFNRSPQIVDLTFSPSKFIRAGEKTTVCAKTNDPDGNQIEVEWSQVGDKSQGQPTITPAEGADQDANCVAISPDAVGRYDFEVRIYDLLRDQNGQQVRFEKWHADHGSPNTSSDSLRFMIHAGNAAAGNGQGNGSGKGEGNGGRETQRQERPQLRADALMR